MVCQSKALFTYNNLVHAVSGAVGSMVGMVVFYPLDTVRSRLQLEENRVAKNTFQVLIELVKEEGVGTLYRGIVPVLQSICASNFVYFYIYHGLKARSVGNKAGKDLVLASIAGMINVLLTTPLWMVNTRMKMAGVTEAYRYKSLLDGLLKVSRLEGLRTLWAGTIPSLILVSNPAIHMAVYEAIKRRLPPRELSAVNYFLISAIAKMVATFLTYPLQLAQAKLRHGHCLEGLSSNAGTIQLLLYLLKRQGVEGLYKGMEAKLLQTVLTTSLMFMIYEKIAAFVLALMRHKK
ncbi:peroxisomal membrane protein PMP34 [Cimex lectularius]|uniref:Mitochondrial carrier protein n=1 Tax=Cimex lectularius TaxID=79782 RepID=A0A8I6RJ75_CIMLE|nr:peroxisomal membrane protein PMP34 [Cimex lectularius]